MSVRWPMVQGIIAPNQNKRIKIWFGQLMFSSSHVVASKNKDGIKKNSTVEQKI